MPLPLTSPDPPTSAQELLERYNAGERNFAGAQLSEAQLAGAQLAGASLAGANLDSADLRGADLSGANLLRASLKDANLRMTKLPKSKLDGADLTRAELTQAFMNGADAAAATFVGATLEMAELESADLSWAKLKGARLVNARMRGAKLLAADFEGADLQGTTGVRFNSSLTRGARLSPRPDDPWSELKRWYTGTMFAFHLLLLVAFVIPYVGRTAMWVGVTKIQGGVADTLAHLEAKAKKIQLPDGGVLIEALREAPLTPCLANNCRQWSVWQVLLGLDRSGWWARILSCLAGTLILYNICRAVLTWWVGLLRDVEDRSGWSPGWSQYQHAVAVHRGMKVAFWFAVISFAAHAVEWLFLSRVWLPA